MPTRTFIDAIRETLAEEMRRDETVIVPAKTSAKGGCSWRRRPLAEFGDERS
jgi:pyruvate/2-oxoglutarate/acetoin dehydrogenase E1 component